MVRARRVRAVDGIPVRRGRELVRVMQGTKMVGKGMVWLIGGRDIEGTWWAKLEGRGAEGHGGVAKWHDIAMTLINMVGVQWDRCMVELRDDKEHYVRSIVIRVWSKNTAPIVFAAFAQSQRQASVVKPR